MRILNDTFRQVALLLMALIMMSCAALIGPDIKPGVALFEEGKYGASLDHFENIIASGKANGKVYRLAYESAFMAGKRITAGTYYTEAIKAGFDADSLVSLATNLWYDRALYTMGSNNWIEARKAAVQIADLADDSKQDKFCTLILAGKKKFDRGAHKGLWDAISDYSKAANYDKDSGLPYFLMGQARYKNNRTDYDAALEDYYEAIRIEPAGAFVKQAKADIKKIETVKKKMNAFWGK